MNYELHLRFNRSRIKAFFNYEIRLSSAFSWAHTPQGYSYWNSLYLDTPPKGQREKVAEMLLSLGLCDLVPEEYTPIINEDLLWE